MYGEVLSLYQDKIHKLSYSFANTMKILILNLLIINYNISNVFSLGATKTARFSLKMSEENVSMLEPISGNNFRAHGANSKIDRKKTSMEKISGVSVTSVVSSEKIELSHFLRSGTKKSMIIFGTYAADFNAIEYAQRLRYYLPQLKERGIGKIGFILNSDADAAKKLVQLVDLQTDATSDDSIIELFIDPSGEAGRRFGVGRGWKPDDQDFSPYLKLFGMLFGLGAWATLPAVIGGYLGNPFLPQPWIEDALAVGQRYNRFPSNALELDESGRVVVNKFKELPLVGEWERRPLELATLRLQNMVDISIKYWSELAPSKDALDAGVLTQLGGCLVVESSTGKDLFRWRDPGICAVTNFEDILKKISDVN